MTEKQETLRELLAKWRVADYEQWPEIHRCADDLAPIVERAEDIRELCDELREADLSKTSPNSVAELVGNRLRDVLGRKD